MLASAGVRGVAAVLLLAVHVIAMAAAAKLFDDLFEGSLPNNITNPALQDNASWNIIGFLFAAGFAIFELLTLSGGEKDASASFGLACTLLASGLIELGFAAKAAKLSQTGLTDTYKACEGFGIIAGGFSMFVFLIKTASRLMGGGGGSSATA